MDIFKYLSSWFQMDDEDDDYKKEKDDLLKNNENDLFQDTDLIKDKKKYNKTNQQNLSKVKKGRKSVRFTSGLTNKTKKRRP